MSRDIHRRSHWIFESFGHLNSGDCFSLWIQEIAFPYMNLWQIDIDFRYIYKSSYLLKKFASTRIRTRASGSRTRCSTNWAVWACCKMCKFETERFFLLPSCIFLQIAARFYGVEMKVGLLRKLKTWTLKALSIPYVIESFHNLNLRL